MLYSSGGSCTVHSIVDAILQHLHARQLEASGERLAHAAFPRRGLALAKQPGRAAVLSLDEPRPVIAAEENQRVRIEDLPSSPCPALRPRTSPVLPPGRHRGRARSCRETARWPPAAHAEK